MATKKTKKVVVKHEEDIIPEVKAPEQTRPMVVVNNQVVPDISRGVVIDNRP